MTHDAGTSVRLARAVELIEGALYGTEPRRAIWTDQDYLIAALTLLTGDGDRGRRAAANPYAVEHQFDSIPEGGGG